MRTLSLLVCALLPLASACGKKTEEKKEAPKSAPTPSAPNTAVQNSAPSGPGNVTAAAAPKGPHVEGPGYVLDITPASADVAAGAEQVAKLTIHPTSGFHVNKDYPIELTVQPPDGVTVANGSQTGDDAKKLEETEADFDLKYTAKDPGAKQVLASIKFAVCTPTSCNPKKEMLSFQVNAR